MLGMGMISRVRGVIYIRHGRNTAMLNLSRPLADRAMLAPFHYDSIFQQDRFGLHAIAKHGSVDISEGRTSHQRESRAHTFASRNGNATTLRLHPQSPVGREPVVTLHGRSIVGLNQLWFGPIARYAYRIQEGRYQWPSFIFQSSGYTAPDEGTESAHFSTSAGFPRRTRERSNWIPSKLFLPTIG